MRNAEPIIEIEFSEVLCAKQRWLFGSFNPLTIDFILLWLSSPHPVPRLRCKRRAPFKSCEIECHSILWSGKLCVKRDFFCEKKKKVRAIKRACIWDINWIVNVENDTEMRLNSISSLVLKHISIDKIVSRK